MSIPCCTVPMARRPSTRLHATLPVAQLSNEPVNRLWRHGQRFASTDTYITLQSIPTGIYSTLLYSATCLTLPFPFPYLSYWYIAAARVEQNYKNTRSARARNCSRTQVYNCIVRQRQMRVLSTEHIHIHIHNTYIHRYIPYHTIPYLHVHS